MPSSTCELEFCRKFSSAIFINLNISYRISHSDLPRANALARSTRKCRGDIRKSFQHIYFLIESLFAKWHTSVTGYSYFHIYTHGNGHDAFWDGCDYHYITWPFMVLNSVIVLRLISVRINKLSPLYIWATDMVLLMQINNELRFNEHNGYLRPFICICVKHTGTQYTSARIHNDDLLYQSFTHITQVLVSGSFLLIKSRGLWGCWRAPLTYCNTYVSECL